MFQIRNTALLISSRLTQFNVSFGTFHFICAYSLALIQLRIKVTMTVFEAATKIMLSLLFFKTNWVGFL